MNKYMKSLFLFAAIATLSACELDHLGEEDSQEGNGEVGYLALSNVSVNADTEYVLLNDSSTPTTRDGETTDDTTGEGSTTPTPKEADDNYYITITESASGIVKWEGTYAEAKAAMTANKTSLGKEGIALEPATYIVTAYQTKTPDTDIANVAESKPYYIGVSTPIEVKKKEVVSTTVTCKLANILTTVELSADLKAVFKNYTAEAEEYEEKRLKTTVTLGTDVTENTYVFEKEATHTAPLVYFKDVAGTNSQDGNAMTIVLSGEYYTGNPEHVGTVNEVADKWKTVKMTKTVSNVRAAQWRKISIGISNATGNVQFEVTVESFVFDEEISVDVMTLYAALNTEEVIPDIEEEDPKAPSVVINGQSELTYDINSSIYNADGEYWNSTLQLLVSPTEGSTVSTVYANVSSANAAFLLALAQNNSAVTRSDASDVLRIDFYPTNTLSNFCKAALVSGSNDVKITFNQKGMDEFYKYPGEHTFSIYTTDSQNRTKHTDVVVNVSEGGSTGGGPSVVWYANGSPANSIVLNTNASGEVIKVSITSETGLTGLSVNIDSNVLTPEELSTFQLAQNMDLFNPATAMMETRLRAFGFLPIEGYDESTMAADKGTMAAADDNYRIYYPDTETETNKRKDNAVSPLLGEKSIEFDISSFMGMLKGLGTEDESTPYTNFTISASDSSGKTSAIFKITVE